MTAAMPMPKDGVSVSGVKPGSRALVDADGTVFSLSRKAFDAALNAAMGVSGKKRMVTTGKAADLLHVSLRTVDRILDSGAIPFVRHGARGHRMVDVEDVMRYKRQSGERRQDALRKLHEVIDEIDMTPEEEAAYTGRFE